MPVGMHLQKKEQALETERLKNRVMVELYNHVGEFNAIGMAELYEIVTGDPWANRINDTRKIRRIITTLRREGAPIASSSKASNGGYYIPAAGSETVDFLRRRERRALKILAINARIKKTNLPNYLGQLSLDMEGTDAETYAG